MELLNAVRRGPYLWLLAILIVGFLIRWWILDDRWINPDEGAHIMDGRLVLDGLVPKVDYDARQPFYVYSIAFILKVFGINYMNVRLFLPLICSIMVAILTFFIAQKLFNDKVALASSAIYTFLPLSIIESTIVKTEPLTTMLSCLGAYMVVSAVWGGARPRLLLFLTGVALALAYYVRESSLAILLGISLFLFVVHWGSIQKLLRDYLVIAAGYLFICLLAFAYYNQYMTLSQLLDSPINPADIVLEKLGWAFETTASSAATLEMSPLNLNTQPWSETFRYLHLTLFLNAPLFVGLVLSVFMFVHSPYTSNIGENFHRGVFLQFSLLYLWVFSLALAYAFWTMHRGYFIQYFEEFLPPLSILLAYVIVGSLSYLKLPASNRRMSVTILIPLLVLLLLIIFYVNRALLEFQIESAFYFLLAILLLASSYLLQVSGLGRWLLVLLGILALSAVLVALVSIKPPILKIPLYLLLFLSVYLAIFKLANMTIRRDLGKACGFIFISLIMSSFLLSFAVAGRNLGLDFDCVWAPETVREISDYIRSNSSEGDEVMSGGVIWELQANRRPFMNQSHPQVYAFDISPELSRHVNQQITDHPPKFIILDGYTEKSYLKQFSGLEDIMAKKYDLRKVVEGSRYPVKIYELETNNINNKLNEKARMLLRSDNSNQESGRSRE